MISILSTSFIHSYFCPLAKSQNQSHYILLIRYESMVTVESLISYPFPFPYSLSATLSLYFPGIYSNIFQTCPSLRDLYFVLLLLLPAPIFFQVSSSLSLSFTSCLLSDNILSEKTYITFPTCTYYHSCCIYTSGIFKLRSTSKITLYWFQVYNIMI